MISLPEVMTSYAHVTVQVVAEPQGYLVRLGILRHDSRTPDVEQSTSSVPDSLKARMAFPR